MKVLVLDTYYWPLLVETDLDKRQTSPSQKEQAQIRASALSFGTGAAYVRHLSDLGHTANLVVPNSPALQLDASGGKRSESVWQRLVFRYAAVIARIPFIGSLVIQNSDFFQAIQGQIHRLQPDVLIVLDINLFPGGLLRALASAKTLRVGEIASPLPPKRFIKGYDLILSAHPGLVEQIQNLGVKAIWQPLGFDTDSEVTPKTNSNRDIDVVFIGSFGRLQKNTGPLLAEVKKLTPSLEIYGNASEKTLRKYDLLENYRGTAWGTKMHEVLGRSKISINRHGEIAGPYAANMRLYESTAAGSLLVTEEKSNLSELFLPGVEVVTYGSNQEAAERVRYYLDHPDQLAQIAKAGQAKTFSSHTYRQRVSRMADELDLLSKEIRS